MFPAQTWTAVPCPPPEATVEIYSRFLFLINHMEGNPAGDRLYRMAFMPDLVLIFDWMTGDRGIIIEPDPDYLRVILAIVINIPF